MILEADIIRFLDHKDYGATELFGKIISYLEKEIRELIGKFKSMIPNKAKKYKTWPQVIWIPPSMHKNYVDNNFRRKFAGEMEQIIKGKPNSSVFKIKQVWQPNNDDLVYEHNSNLSPSGERKLWLAFDRTLWFADRILFNNIQAFPRRNTAQTRRRLPVPTSNNRLGCHHDRS